MNIKDAIKSNQIVIIWVVAFVLLIVLVILTAVLNVGKPKTPEKVISVNILSQQTGSNSVEYSIPYTVTNKIVVDPELPVYETSKKDLMDKIDAFIQLHKLKLTKTTCDKNFCNWTGADGTIEQDYRNALVYFDFKKKVSNLISSDNVNSDKASEAMKEFAMLFGISNTYKNSNFNKEGDAFRVEVSREIDGKKVYMVGYKEYTDYIVVDLSGGVQEARLTAFEIHQSTKDLFSSLLPSQIGTLVNTDGYQRAVYWGSVSGLLEDLNEKVSAEVKNTESIADYSEKLVPTGCTVKSGEVIMYYSGKDNIYVVPMYKFQCEGKIEYNDKEYIVPGTLFTPAIQLSK